MTNWYILTGEYPPDCGGVGDYAAQVARGLADAGDRVTVFHPRRAVTPVPLDGVTAVALPDHFGSASRREIDRALATEAAPPVLLVQYVPQAFGFGGTNLPFCLWVSALARRGCDVRVMFHEPYAYFSWRVDRDAIALVQRLMAGVLLRAARRVYFSTPTWTRYLAIHGPAASGLQSVPIPSAIPRIDDDAAVVRVRARFAPGGEPLVGHFGTYGNHVSALLGPALVSLLKTDTRPVVLCIGRSGESFVKDLERRRPALAGHLHATGHLSPEAVSAHLQACDVLLQPYPEGVTTRRTSIMAGLANGRAIVTTSGPLSEPIWAETAAVALEPPADAARLASTCRSLLADVDRRNVLAARGALLYESSFTLSRTIAVLRADAREVPAA